MACPIIKNMRKNIALVLFTFCLSGCETMPDLGSILDTQTSTSLSSSTIAAGLREALSVGSVRAVDTLGVEDGFLKSAFHIPLPEKLAQAQEIAGRFGLSGMFDELEVQLNRAAEAAAPQASELFVDAIKQMTFEDVMTIYRGSDDAATQYLRRTTAPALESKMRPIVDKNIAQVGAVSTFKDLAARYNALPLVKPVDADISGHVLNYSSEAIFTQLAKEEAAIRNDPVKRTTQLLQRVFAN